MRADRPTPTLNSDGLLEAVTAPAPDLRAMLAAFRAGLQAELSPHLVAVYISGSLVMGDFEPASSDVDFLVVTREPVQRGEAQRAGAGAAWRSAARGRPASPAGAGAPLGQPA